MHGLRLPQVTSMSDEFLETGFSDDLQMHLIIDAIIDSLCICHIITLYSLAWSTIILLFIYC